MRLLVLLLLFFLPLAVISQDCPDDDDFVFNVVSPCPSHKGSLTIEIKGFSHSWTNDNFGLFRVDLGDFERNRINNNGLQIDGDKITYEGIEGGEYKLALYLKTCQNFPRPLLFPSEAIVVEVLRECK